MGMRIGIMVQELQNYVYSILPIFGELNSEISDEKRKRILYVRTAGHEIFEEQVFKEGE